jgi:hypothetical protein
MKTLSVILVMLATAALAKPCLAQDPCQDLDNQIANVRGQLSQAWSQVVAAQNSSSSSTLQSAQHLSSKNSELNGIAQARDLEQQLGSLQAQREQCP